MRTRTREKLKKKNTAITLLFLLPLLGFGTYAAGALYILNDMTSFTFDEKIKPDTSYFTPRDEINITLLAEIAEQLEIRNNKYHLPTNLSVSLYMKDHHYDSVRKWRMNDNGGLRGGEMLFSECLRYATAKRENNEQSMNHSMAVIKKLVDGFATLMAAPNGGLGPEYPGLLARFYAAPKHRDIFPRMFAPHYKHFNGSGPYKNWRVRLKTSKDELGGYALGLASILEFVDPSDGKDAKWCYNTVKLIIDQLLQGFLKNNWLLLDGDGWPDGVDLHPYFFSGGAWQLTYLKLGAVAYPKKYESRYNYYAAKTINHHFAGEGSPHNTVMEFFAYNFAQALVFALIMLEDDPQLKQLYIKKFEESFYKILKYHRNAWHNAAHLAFMSMLEEEERKKFANPEYTDDTIIWDVLDQLYRFKDWVNPKGMSLTKEQWGVRDYNLTQRPHSTRATSKNPEIRKMKRDPTPKKWRDFFDNHPFGSLYAWLEKDLLDFEDHYLLPVTVSEQGGAAIIWNRNAFYTEGGDPEGNGLKENRGLSFLLPYWIGRYYGFIDSPT
jgi:hypothetical protein